jgi:hypothetical protein
VLILVDGTWDIVGRAATTLVVFDPGGQVRYIKTSQVQANNPFHFEAMPILQGVQTGL